MLGRGALGRKTRGIRKCQSSSKAQHAEIPWKHIKPFHSGRFTSGLLKHPRLCCVRAHGFIRKQRLERVSALRDKQQAKLHSICRMFDWKHTGYWQLSSDKCEAENNHRRITSKRLGFMQQPHKPDLDIFWISKRKSSVQNVHARMKALNVTLEKSVWQMINANVHLWVQLMKSISAQPWVNYITSHQNDTRRLQQHLFNTPFEKTNANPVQTWSGLCGLKDFDMHSWFCFSCYFLYALT